MHGGGLGLASEKIEIDGRGFIAGAADKGEGLGNQFLANIREADAICQVVRVFADDDVVYALIREQVTAERVKQHFGSLVRGDVLRLLGAVAPVGEVAPPPPAAASRFKLVGGRGLDRGRVELGGAVGG